LPGVKLAIAGACFTWGAATCGKLKDFDQAHGVTQGHGQYVADPNVDRAASNALTIAPDMPLFDQLLRRTSRAHEAQMAKQAVDSHASAASADQVRQCREGAALARLDRGGAFLLAARRPPFPQVGPRGTKGTFGQRPRPVDAETRAT